MKAKRWSTAQPRRLALALAMGVVACGQVDSQVGAIMEAQGGGAGEGSKAQGNSTASGGRASTGGQGAAAGAREPGAGGSTGGTGAMAGAGGSTGARSSVALDGGLPIYTRVQRLTNAQWRRAVTDILGLAAPPEAAQDLAEPVVGTTDFSNNEYGLFVDLRSALEFELATEAAAAQATASTEALAALYPGTDREGFVRTLGRRAFRRPLTEAEEVRYQGVFARGEELYGPGFGNGAALVIRAMLSSPLFLYRSELGPAGEALSGYEAASKLSFLLLGTTPSDALLDAAAAGALDSVEALEAAAREMLEQPAAVEVMRDFHGQLYRFYVYPQVYKSDVAEWSPEFNPELTEVSYRFFDRVFERGEGLEAILTSTRGFAGPGLAPLYSGEPVPSGIEERELGPSRLGYFMQIPFLMAWSLGRAPDSIHRGMMISSQVLCARLPPPAEILPPLPPLEAGSTNRQRVTNATESCGGECHAYIDPLGFSFEAFDGMGVERELDNGEPIDSSGTYPFSDGVASFEDARELMQLLAKGTQAHRCYAKMLSGYGLQRNIVTDDSTLLDALSPVSRENSTKELIVALVKNPAFRMRQENQP